MVKTDMVRRRAGDKASGFSVTCSLLSQYLKEKGGLGDVALGLSALALADGRGKPEVLRTRNLLPGVEAAMGEADGQAASWGKDPALSMGLFPPRAGFGPADEKNLDHNREAHRGQMTIFYGGKVLVFDNFPADKAGALMAMAGRGCPAPAQRSKAEQPAPPQRPSCPPPAQHKSAAATIAPALASNSEAKSAAPTPAVAAPEAPPQKPTQPPASGMPIARRASLHRFLEKRKDRISAKAPYPVSSSPAKAAEESLQWLGLAPHASKPGDLHLHA